MVNNRSLELNMSNLPQQNTRVQYTADGITDVYGFDFLVTEAADETWTVNVYVQAPDAAPDPDVDIQEQQVAYTISGLGDITGGYIQFLAGYIPDNGYIVTIVGHAVNTIETEFANTTNFNAQNLDDNFQLVMRCIQQNTTQINNTTLRYAINSYLSDPENQTLMPVLGDNQVWIGQGDRIIAATILSSDSLLRSQLESEVNGGDGAGLIGYFDTNNSMAQTLRTFLNNLPTYISNIVFQTGQLKFTYNITPQSGWIVLQEGTIGSATSGATRLASATAQALYYLLWNGTIDTDCPVTGGRGVSAAADFSANKPMALPAANGVAFVNKYGSSLGRIAQKIGTAEVTLTVDEIPPHAHRPSNLQKYITDGPGGSSFVGGTDFQSMNTSEDVGGGLPHNNIQPSNMIYVHIKL